MEAVNARKEAGAWRHPWQLLLSAVLVVFVALSIAASESFLAAVVVLCILAMVAIFRFVFASGSRLLHHLGQSRRGVCLPLSVFCRK
jgi:uncharacterized membrane protein HdeD (DUF308 family)